MFFTPTGLIDNFNTLETIHTQSGPQMYNALTKACLHPKKILLLIEHIKGAQTLRDKINMREFVSSDLIHSLFQVYFTLNALKDVFTHYDLHCQNVLTYIPIQNKCLHKIGPKSRAVNCAIVGHRFKSPQGSNKTK